MRYMLLIGGEDSLTANAEEICHRPETRAWIEEMTSRGVLVGGELLRPPADAATVRVRNGEMLVTDGPFVEAKEQIGGTSVIEAADLDEAVKIAAAHPMAGLGTIEVRPVIEQ